MPDPTKEQLDFAWKVHSYTNEYIRFADSKAGLTLAVAAGLVASLFGAKAHAYIHWSRLWFVCGQFEWESTLIGIFSLVSFLGLLAAAVLLVWAIEPRIWSKSHEDKRTEMDAMPPLLVTSRGLIYWELVRAHGTAAAYEAELKDTDCNAQITQVTAHIFVLGDIAKRKYVRIKWAIWAGCLGTLASLITLYLIRI